MIEVQVTTHQLIGEPFVAKIAEEFAEWLERQGFRLVYHSGTSVTDQRSFEELAKDFVEDYSAGIR